MTNINANPCSCGCVETHVVAVRETADGHRVKVWSDGMVTHADPFGTHIRGIGSARSTHTKKAYPRTAADLAASVSLFDFSELRTLVKTIRECVWHTYSTEDARRQDAIRIASKRLQKSTVNP